VPTSIDTTALQKLLTDDTTVQLVDVLPAETFRQEHLPGAVNVPLAEIESAPDKLDPTRPVVVYCFDYQ